MKRFDVIRGRSFDVGSKKGKDKALSGGWSKEERKGKKII